MTHAFELRNEIAPAASAAEPAKAGLVPDNDAAPHIENACARVPPLWPLKNFVAVNPFVGLSNKTFLDACRLMRRVLPGGMMPPAAHFRRQLAEGGIRDADLHSALDQLGMAFPLQQIPGIEAGATAAMLREALQDAPGEPTLDGRERLIHTVADAVDALRGTQWAAFIVDEISKWCSSYYDAGQATWSMPWRSEPLFAAWKQAARRDANPEMNGLRGFRACVAGLPDEPAAVIGYALGILRVPAAHITDFLHRQLMSVAGWSGYAQYQARENGMRGRSDESLVHLLAIRLAYDLALYQRNDEPEFTRHWTMSMLANPYSAGDAAESALAKHYLLQIAAEHAFQRVLMTGLAGAPTPSDSPRPRPAVQAVFCIDVRSEVYRRALESQSPEIETLGFAGFFGFPIEYIAFGESSGRAQCPVLIAPGYRIREAMPGASSKQVDEALLRQTFLRRLARSWRAFKSSAASCFSFVETAGLLSGPKLVADSLGLHLHEPPSTLAMAPQIHREALPPPPGSVDGAILSDIGMSLDEQVKVAASALKNMGLTENLARLVVFCGHGSVTSNNPYGSGLDCGACGGHSGQANARVAAAVLNHPPVRQSLRAQGFQIPEDTLFIAALHNTTTDDVALLDPERMPESHAEDLRILRHWLDAAAHQSRQQRAPALGLGTFFGAQLDRRVRARSQDWAQTRPEWGLAGNAAFIAAPRGRTRGLNLAGRAFLNSYDYRTDVDGSKLELIMTAPLVVASWINLQYFASTANNRYLGSGNKTIHNVVGTIGVWQGNSGDLQVGLPLQSVHNGHKWMHEPLRLTALIEAPVEMIDRVINAHANIRELLNNGWLHLLAIEDEGRRFMRYCGESGWKRLEVVPG